MLRSAWRKLHARHVQFKEHAWHVKFKFNTCLACKMQITYLACKIPNYMPAACKIQITCRAFSLSTCVSNQGHGLIKLHAGHKLDQNPAGTPAGEGGGGNIPDYPMSWWSEDFFWGGGGWNFLFRYFFVGGKVWQVFFFVIYLAWFKVGIFLVP